MLATATRGDAGSRPGSLDGWYWDGSAPGKSRGWAEPWVTLPSAVDRSRLARAEVGVAHRVDRVGARRSDRVLHAARHGENAGKRRQNADRAKFSSSPRALHSCTPPLLSLPKP